MKKRKKKKDYSEIFLGFSLICLFLFIFVAIPILSVEQQKRINERLSVIIENTAAIYRRIPMPANPTSHIDYRPWL